MRSVLYLFNGTGWGDHFLAIPFIKRHTKIYGSDSLLVVTYESHIEKLFRNIEGQYIGLKEPKFCYKKIKDEILQFGPNRLICFNAFNGFDFDCQMQIYHSQIKYYGTYSPEGISIRHSYKDYAHTRDQYFLLPGEKAEYTQTDRHISFTDEEEKEYRSKLHNFLTEIELDKTILIHLDSESRKLWDPASWFLTLRELIDKGKKIVFVGSNQEMIKTYLKYLPEAFFLHEPDIRKVFWFVKQCKQFIAIDSVFMHIADAYELNGIVLFSDYPAHEWAPISPRIDVVYPAPGKQTRDIPLEQVNRLINQRFFRA